MTIFFLIIEISIPGKTAFMLKQAPGGSQLTQATIYMYIDNSVQDCSISSALAMEILQSCAKPSIYAVWIGWPFIAVTCLAHSELF